MHLAVEEVALVDTGTVFPDEFAASRVDTVPPGPIIFASVGELHPAISVNPVVVELASIGAFRHFEDTMAVSRVAAPLALVPASVFVFVNFDLFSLRCTMLRPRKRPFLLLRDCL